MTIVKNKVAITLSKKEKDALVEAQRVFNRIEDMMDETELNNLFGVTITARRTIATKELINEVRRILFRAYDEEVLIIE